MYGREVKKTQRYDIDIYPLRIYTTLMDYKQEPLTPAVFYILLALSIKERHGYDIMKQVEADSHGKVNMGPGTLYGSIKRMLKAGLIVEVDDLEDTRRKFYRLTKIGQDHLSAEVQRYSEVVTLAKDRKLLGVDNVDFGV
jgi:DNA-binding PadR family transcriptional regulator